MSAEERPLPKPPGTPFGRKRRFEQEEEQPSLIADQMAMAMAEGRLDEFMKKEMPDNEYCSGRGIPRKFCDSCRERHTYL